MISDTVLYNKSDSGTIPNPPAFAFRLEDNILTFRNIDFIPFLHDSESKNPMSLSMLKNYDSNLLNPLLIIKYRIACPF